MKNKMNNKAFSLVELLAVIVILGLLSVIGIAAVSSLIDRAKAEKINSQKDTIKMAAQSYLQDNKNLAPKIIGDTKNIKVSELKKNNYIVENIKNDKDESCMENSYVRVYKLSKTEYTYDVYMYCGDEEVPERENIPSPIITAKFSDSSGEIKNEKLNNVSDAYLYIEIVAAKEHELRDYRSQNNPIFIDGYSFIISSNGKEVYNSGSLSAGRKEKILINKKLKDYINVTGITEVSVDITAINTIGGVLHVNKAVSETGDVEVSKYEDKVKPKCVKPDSPYNEDDWLNKDEYILSKKARKLTVGCDDGAGSQCIRNYFTKSWPNDTTEEYKKGAEFVYIDVKDNAGNVSEHNDECKFRVNVDIQTPSASITAYAGLQSNSNETSILASKITGSNVLKNKIEVKDSNSKIKIDPTSEYYQNLVGKNTTNKWMNKENYPQGVIYKIELKDNIRLHNWTWNTNAGYIDSMSSAEYLKVTGTNPEAAKGNVPQDASHGKTNLHGSTKDTVYVRFLTEGMRYGVFTAYDKAGNSIKIEISANLDRTSPPVPETLNAYVYNKERTAGTSVTSTAYSFGTWTNRYVRVQTGAGQDRDNLTSGVTLSGFWQYYYDARNNSNTRVGSSDYSTYASGVGLYDFKGTASQVDGKNKIRFRACDKANNCSEWGSYKEEWIDITVPTCTVEKTITGKESDQGWLGINEQARVTATCNDPTSTQASGCRVTTLYHDYNYEIDTSKAGAVGNNNGGTFTDNAGNIVKCVADKRVQIDYSSPTCTVSGGDSTWTNGSRTVFGTCHDTGGSGCRGNISYKYDVEINTSKAGAAGNNNGGQVVDKADNYVNCEANQPVRIDKTPPTCAVSGGSDSWINKNSTTQSRTITAKCSDTGGSGCATADFSKTYADNINTDKAGAKGIDNGGSVSDNAGNSVNCAANQKVKIDKTPPTCAVSGGSETWTNGSRTIKGKCSDTGGSGCKEDISYKYDVEINTTTAGAAGNNDGGTVFDKAGNSVKCDANQKVKIDKTAPECTVSGGSDSWTNGSRTIKGKCSDTGGSGCKEDISYKYDVEINTTTAGAAGNKAGGTVFDKAGNSVNCDANQKVKIDKTKPTCSLEVSGTKNSGGNYNSDVTVSLEYSDSSPGSGIAGYGISSSSSTDYNGSTSLTAINNGTYTYYGFVKDNVGNTNSCSKSFTIQKYSCSSGDLTYDESKGGYICVKDATESSEVTGWTQVSCNSYCPYVLAEFNKICSWCWDNNGASVCSCPTGYSTVFKCDDGWTKFTTDSKTKCYKSADSGTKQELSFDPNNPEYITRWRKRTLSILKGTE